MSPRFTPVSSALFAGLQLLVAPGCDNRASTPPPKAANSQPAAALPASVDYTYEIVGVTPHDRAAFTQGLVYFKGILFESTGLNGRSTLRKVELQTGRVLQQIKISPEFFAEGMTILGDKIYQVTWQNQKGFVYDLSTFTLEKEFTYPGEGWGLTTDGRSLILSDGTQRLRFLDPVTFKIIRTLDVVHRGQPLRLLNELEYVRGEIYANVWQTQSVARIDPATGHVLGLIDFSGLLSPSDHTRDTDVLNGIAYDTASDRLFVTGKKWPKLFEVRVRPK